MRAHHTIGALAAATLLAAAPLLALTPAASAATTCTADVCAVDDSVDTPLGPVTVTVSSTSVITVHLAATLPTVVLGVPFTFPEPPIAGCPGGCSRTTIATTAAVINIDELLIPPGPPGRYTLPNIAVISIHPPGPCRAQTTGTTVTFTPIIPPGPPA
jgi:hypothetical protein